MPFTVTYDSNIDCVVTRISGNMDTALITDFFSEIGKVAATNNCIRVLSDLREGKIAAPMTDIYEMAKSLDKLKILKSFKRAIVISQDHKDYQFWETVCYNQGYHKVKLFTDYEQAKKWLLAN